MLLILYMGKDRHHHKALYDGCQLQIFNGSTGIFQTYNLH